MAEVRDGESGILGGRKNLYCGRIGRCADGWLIPNIAGFDFPARNQFWGFSDNGSTLLLQSKSGSSTLPTSTRFWRHFCNKRSDIPCRLCSVRSAKHLITWTERNSALLTVNFSFLIFRRCRLLRMSKQRLTIPWPRQQKRGLLTIYVMQDTPFYFLQEPLAREQFALLILCRLLPATGSCASLPRTQKDNALLAFNS